MADTGTLVWVPANHIISVIPYGQQQDDDPDMQLRHLAYWSALCIIGLLCGAIWAAIELLNTALPGAGPRERRMTRITDRRRVSDLWLMRR